MAAVLYNRLCQAVITGMQEEEHPAEQQVVEHCNTTTRKEVHLANFKNATMCYTDIQKRGKACKKQPA